LSGFVLDTSVAVAWYLPETFTVEARRWQARLLAGDDRFVVPRLHYWEMANVLRTSVLRGRLSAPLAQDIWELHLDAPLEVVEPQTAGLLARALELGATSYDAVFVELALSLDLQLLTAERVSRPWVAGLGARAVVLGAEA
jgi:predicted nucleic acid-binding protein